MSTCQTPIETAAYHAACENIANTENLWQRLIAHAEQGVLKAALEHNQGNQVKTAKQLGIHRSTLRQRIALYGLQQTGKA